MDTLAGLIAQGLAAPDDEQVATQVHEQVKGMCRSFPLYPELFRKP